MNKQMIDLIVYILLSNILSSITAISVYLFLCWKTGYNPLPFNNSADFNSMEELTEEEEREVIEKSRVKNKTNNHIVSEATKMVEDILNQSTLNPNSRESVNRLLGGILGEIESIGKMREDIIGSLRYRDSETIINQLENLNRIDS